MSATGVDRYLAPRTRGRGVILMLHHVRPWRDRRFAPNRLLEVTPGFLDTVVSVVREEGFDIVSMDEVVERIAHPQGGRPFAAITFDDGYRDTARYAAPVLRRHGVPWTLFVTPGYADRTSPLWWLELEEGIRGLDRIVLDLPEGRVTYTPRTDAQKTTAFKALYWRLRNGPEAVLREATQALALQAGVNPHALVEAECLDWEGLRELASEPDVTIGAHTLTHPMLAKHDEAHARHEIFTSKTRIEDEINHPVRHFAYPVGDPGSAGIREFALTKEAGFASGVTTRPGHVFEAHGAHLHALPRVSLNGLFQSETAIRSLLSGAPFFFWNKGRKLNVA